MLKGRTRYGVGGGESGRRWAESSDLDGIQGVPHSRVYSDSMLDSCNY
jgi:hypothetical protein